MVVETPGSPDMTHRYTPLYTPLYNNHHTNMPSKPQSHTRPR